jgi:PAS domain S-box-containing protein
MTARQWQDRPEPKPARDTIREGASGFAIFVGCLVIIGWVLRIDVLKRLVPGAVEMAFNTAVAIILCGMSLRLFDAEGEVRRNRRLACALAGLAALIGLLTLAEHITRWNLGFDLWIFGADTETASTFPPGRMSPAAAMSVLLLGLALVTRGNRWRPWLPEALTFPVALLGVLGVITMAYGVWAPTGLAAHFAMSLHTCLAFLALALSLLAGSANGALRTLLSSKGSGGAMARSLAPFAFLLPIVIGWIAVFGVRAALYGAEFGVAILALGHGALLAGLFLWHARVLDRVDVERGAAAEVASERARLAAFSADIATAVTQNDTLRIILGRCAEAMARHLDAAYAQIWTLEEIEKAGRSRSATGSPPTSDGFQGGVPFGKVDLKAILEERRPYISSKLIGDPCVIDQGWARREGLVAFAGYPLIVGGQVVGAMAMFTRKPLTDGICDSLASMAKGIALRIEHKRAEGALWESESRFRRLAESNILGVIVVDLNGSILDANDAFLEMVGFSRGDWLAGRLRWDEMTSWEYREQDKRAVEELRRSGVCAPYEKECIRKDGSRIPILFGVARLEGTQDKCICFALDLTERRKAQAALESERAALARRVEERTADLRAANEELTRTATLLETERTLLANRVEERTAEIQRANEELARSAQLKDEFLANMSHELRTPLNSVLGLCEALEEGVYGSIDERARHPLRTIEESGRHLLELINDILDLSKIGAGKLELDIGPIQVASLCEASLRFVHETANKKRLSVSSRVSDQVSVVSGDERRLKQVLVNLLSNAVKFTPEGKSIGLEVTGHKGRGEVYFTVWDTGIGISPEDSEQLFHPFVQLDSGLSRKHAGTGLGLSLVQRLADLHGGRVEVTSEPGKGSRFTVTIPWVGSEGVRKGGKKGPAAPKAAAPRGKPLILVAEDNVANVTTVADFLRAKGYEVAVAEDGWAAVEKTKVNRPDLILMDIQMPGIDGLEATRRIRADKSLARIPIVALTAHAMPGDRERCLEMGANDYMTKPVRLQELAASIETQLAKAREPAPKPPTSVPPRIRLAS